MQMLEITPEEAGQRLDKLLGKYLNQAPKSFLYKMMRKKKYYLKREKMRWLRTAVRRRRSKDVFVR